MIDSPFNASWPEWFDVNVDVAWTKPVPHDVLYCGAIPEDDYAYFYAVVARKGGEWLPYYIGMTYRQTVSIRLQQADHIRRLAELREAHPDVTFSICLGVPSFTSGIDDLATIEDIEGMLIYANWHENMLNKRGVDKFRSRQQIYIHNSGWTDHLYKEVSCGVFYRA
ncbi:hypothetical protein [Pseudomonas sp. BIGb0164]|jgi:hypothetical protein|uniref:hypothetical protein n=1 Tax=Pseudomonas sp. BIGb0164 TaxID=2940605 RepID=UPI000EE32CA3|nr:hypothetical protein [Pseudomonas sp. BIGb0164]MCS4250113.1 hypothetical protein [Pseudomonas sp. BIGb0164]HCT05167.1 hypothetical protein [Pseudomonas sp.]